MLSPFPLHFSPPGELPQPVISVTFITHHCNIQLCGSKGCQAFSLKSTLLSLTQGTQTLLSCFLFYSGFLWGFFVCLFVFANLSCLVLVYCSSVILTQIPSTWNASWPVLKCVHSTNPSLNAASSKIFSPVT